jgi:hypothetical protein
MESPFAKISSSSCWRSESTELSLPLTTSRVWFHDGGKDWGVVSVETGLEATSVTCPSSATCHTTIELSHSTIFKSIDGGGVWREISSSHPSVMGRAVRRYALEAAA